MLVHGGRIGTDNSEGEETYLDWRHGHEGKSVGTKINIPY